MATKKKKILKEQKKNLKKVKRITTFKKRVKQLKDKLKSKMKNKKVSVNKIKKTKATKKKIITKKRTQKKVKRTNKKNKVTLKRSIENPLLSPTSYSWESEAVLNPAAVYSGGKIHLFYRALGSDGISRIGYASSSDGINFDTRLSYPVYIAENHNKAQKHLPFTSPARLEFNPDLYTSGGGWGGCEDPRAVVIDGRVYMTFNIFNGWDYMGVAVTSIDEKDLLNKNWFWNNFSYLSKYGDRQKNWVLFPEKINGKFAIFHNLDKGNPNRVHIVYVDELNNNETPSGDDAPDPQRLPDHDVAWHYRTRSAACPPLRTKDGWLLLYHAMDKEQPSRYKVGAMLLDLNNPEKVLYRSVAPILEPDTWYENDYKPGIVYATGAIIKDGILFVYYGGGDKYVNVATIGLNELLNDLKNKKTIKLAHKKSLVN